MKPTQLVKHAVNSGDLFRIKPKTRGSNKSIAIDPSSFNCEHPECDKIGVDTIKCNICLKWICESCHDVPVSKLKPIFNKCKTLYFVCKACDHDDIEVKKSDVDLSNTVSPRPESNFEKMILEKLEGIENRIDDTISKKLAENYKNFDAKIDQVSESYADSIKQNIKPNEQVVDFRKIMEDTKNEELVQQKEREARAHNVIIHGLPEEADSTDGKEGDMTTINEFLTNIEVAAKPDSVTRLGRRNDTKSRPIKVKMKNQNDKDLIMCNLRKLKLGSEKFQKVSVTDDYTVKEREEIRKKVVEAKRKTETEGNGKYIFKVRGTPKNGLIIRRFMTINQGNQQ